MGIKWLAEASCDECGRSTTVKVKLETGHDMSVDYPEGWVVEQPELVVVRKPDLATHDPGEFKRPIKVWCPSHADPAARPKPRVSSP